MKQKLRRGFRKEAEEYALEFRFELGLGKHAPLSAFELADHLEIPVWRLSKIDQMPDETIKYYSGIGSGDLSATTICDGTYREIVYNDSHHPNRQNSSVMHEIAHVLLGHPPKPPMMEDACRHFDPVAENEANQLGFTLLIPKPAALFAYENFSSLSEAATHFGVSRSLMEHRVRITDAIRWSHNRARGRQDAN